MRASLENVTQARRNGHESIGGGPVFKDTFPHGKTHTTEQIQVVICAEKRNGIGPSNVFTKQE